MSGPIGDSSRPEFQSWKSYEDFARRVRQSRRYVWDDEVHEFLDTVIKTMNNREVQIPEDFILWRAQLGIDYDSTQDEEGKEIGIRLLGLHRDRMKPRVQGGSDGRVNSAGIPVLYLATEEQTAISEVRPWLGFEVSVAQFQVVRDLRAINLSQEFGKSPVNYLSFLQLFGEKPVDPERKEKVVWAAIDNAFSRPVTRSEDSSEYVPTQILAELFRDAGFDALVYRSQFGDNGHNVAVFDLEDAKILNCAPYEVEAIEVKYKQIDGPWFSPENLV